MSEDEAQALLGLYAFCRRYKPANPIEALWSDYYRNTAKKRLEKAGYIIAWSRSARKWEFKA